MIWAVMEVVVYGRPAVRAETQIDSRIVDNSISRSRLANDGKANLLTDSVCDSDDTA